jgi:hypothetical protein
VTQRRVEILWELRSKGLGLVAYAVFMPILGGLVGEPLPDRFLA